MLPLKVRRSWQTKRPYFVRIWICVCGLAFAIGCKGGERHVSPETNSNAQPSGRAADNNTAASANKDSASSANPSTSLAQEEYKPTDLPFKALFELGEGGINTTAVKDHTVKTTCSLSLTKEGLRLGNHQIPLKSNVLTRDCMIETKDYGNLWFKISGGSFGGSILVTPTQEKLFRSLLQPPGAV